MLAAYIRVPHKTLSSSNPAAESVTLQTSLTTFNNY